MRWQGSRRSENVEDYRGSRFGGHGLKLGVGGTLLALVAGYFLGIDPRMILGLAESLPESGPAPQAQTGVPQDEAGNFISAVLGETEDTWTDVFHSMGMTYEPPKLVLYTDQVRSACGSASSAVGPFYCPADRRVYLDLNFYDELRTRFQAPGDFAEAYVLAHEVGHHVQTLLGTEDQVRAAQERASESDRNALQVKMELQADCYAGVWAKNADTARHILEQGDVEEALQAASAVGDDTLQKRTQGYVVPDSFTHGTSAQRMSWFKRGLDTGSVSACDTFSR
ncbi:MAG TPA: neutral zinc metallopeptidase [Steroidobacteraceae bacterium]|jgi:predicted metalloprotease|nr:neutral zinc metallopeptidase [Steroidobacteraceae bacterium]